MSPVDQNRFAGGAAAAGGLGSFGVWRCPACGVDQTTDFAQGCPSCGAGKPGEHVGVPTSAAVPPPIGSFFDLATHAFRQWLRQLDGLVIEVTGADVSPHQLFESAFLAGVAYARGGQPVPMSTAAEPSKFTTSGATARTIAAALSHFRDTLYQGADEEVASHEWVDRAELDRLISQYTHAGRELAEGVAR